MTILCPRLLPLLSSLLSLFFFNDPATTEIYTLSLHDALPISLRLQRGLPDADPLLTAQILVALGAAHHDRLEFDEAEQALQQDRKSTRLNSSHMSISYAVFCLKKKKKKIKIYKRKVS